MSRVVLALGVALVTAAGCVWYLPALADVRAGADRPHSRRTGAAACLMGWATPAATAVVLLVSQPWWAPASVAVAGAALTIGLRIRAAVQHRDETREIAAHWAALRHTPPPDRWSHGPSRYTFAALLGGGLVTAVTIAALLLATGPGDGGHWLMAATTSAAVVGVFLAIATTRTHLARKHTTSRPS
ncbi:putative secreted protein [Streptomyces davaonensis JCM 4913]|uniref:Putative secreted protein n=1 Tax=Streptomyces davaonensis (strain DSM 101723 / JCM 4913 / KCC S-0913 / 768) TaxID=1214101 RepID=K4QT32_STRDJ|nr:hypothetical protein [Streptomyces davaonensis]CCK25696.1 putative secreted protein [Streptomyces davaonensis JCM 4913]